MLRALSVLSSFNPVVSFNISSLARASFASSSSHKRRSKAPKRKHKAHRTPPPPLEGQQDGEKKLSKGERIKQELQERPERRKQRKLDKRQRREMEPESFLPPSQSPPIEAIPKKDKVLLNPMQRQEIMESTMKVLEHRTNKSERISPNK
jgi:hypothetical protein